MKRTVAVLGATGSVGLQALDVARKRGYRVNFLSSNSNIKDTEAAAREFRPTAVAMADEKAASELRCRLADTDIRVYSGAEGVVTGISECEFDVAVNSILGEAGLIPSLAVIDKGRRLALANKESLVIAGDTVMSRAKEKGVEIIPVDSEHSAIFQSLKAGKPCEVKRLILTASGGPFYGRTREDLGRVTLAETLNHPTWKMGRKITVDSATLMNKGFEVIEAVHLFRIPAERIEVTVHRQSILHSAVEYVDNSVIGELSVPDMRMCVEYAVDYPDRHPSVSEPLDLFKIGTLTFSRPDTVAFPFIDLAKRAASMGGAMGAVLNASDEVAVDSFLKGRLGFTGIFDVVTECFDRMTEAKNITDLDGIIATDREARELTRSLIKG